MINKIKMIEYYKPSIFRRKQKQNIYLFTNNNGGLKIYHNNKKHTKDSKLETISQEEIKKVLEPKKDNNSTN